MLKIENVRCNNLHSPIAVDCPDPVFSWVLTSDKTDVRQVACQIKVMRQEQLWWDSGRVAQKASYGIVYAGNPLESRSEYMYQVTAWDNQGETAVSDWHHFETAILHPSEWRAGFVEPDALPNDLGFDPLERAASKWGEYVSALMQGQAAEYFDVDGYVKSLPEYPYYPAVQMYRTFSAAAGVVKARLYITAHGVYEFWINGVKPTDVRLAPEFTSYDKLLKYQVYDVSSTIKAGSNAIGVVIADGWYKGKIANGRGCEYGKNPGLLLELELTYSSGEKETVLSDEQFLFSYDGPWRRADIFNGETYDARMETRNFGRVGMDTAGWKAVHGAETDMRRLFAQGDAPIRPIAKVEPISLYTNAAGETILDMGQNFAGHLRLGGMEGAAGTQIVLEHTEELAPDGSFVYPFTGCAQAQKDVYILRGEGKEHYEPAFTYHGFRYVRITGECRHPWRLDQFTGIVVSSHNEPAGSFACSNEKLNRLQQNIVWSQLSNMVGTPTDCPTREKAGWTGDVVIYGKTACFNQSLLNFYREWLRSIRAEQLENGAVQNTVPLIKNYIQQLGTASVGWGDVIITLPWNLYKFYGDVGVLRENYEAMKKWMSCLERMAYDQLPPEARQLTGQALENQHYLLNTGFHFGDWLVPSIKNEAGFADGPKSAFLTGFSVATAIFAGNTDTMSRIAQLLGDDESSARYKSLGEKIRKAFADTYLQPDGTLQNDLQGLYVIALQLNMVPAENRGRLLERLVELIAENGGCMDTGFMSVPHILNVLSQNGKREEAHKLLFQTRCPSWLYEVEQGATTMWESWNAIREDGAKDGCSFNHYAFGCVGDWMYENLLGLGNEGAGYDEIRIEPDLDAGLGWAKGHFDSIHGRIEIEWNKEDDKAHLNVKIPVNVRATVKLGNAEAVTVGSGVHAFSAASK